LVRIERREQNRLRPIRARIGATYGYGSHVLHLSGRDVKPGNLVAACAIDDVRIQWIRRHVAVFDRPDGMPVAVGDLTVVAAAGGAHGAALLLSATDPVREGGCDAHVIEL